MNLADAFSALAKAGCRIKAEVGGGIILDVPPGTPPVPRQVLEVLAAHRESLVAVLAPNVPVPPAAPEKSEAKPPSSPLRLPGARFPGHKHLGLTAGGAPPPLAPVQPPAQTPPEPLPRPPLSLKPTPAEIFARVVAGARRR